MTEYTPTTEEVRAKYADSWLSNEPDPEAAFDRWLARRLPTRDEIAEALHEVGCDGSGCKPRWIDRVSADAVLELLKGEGRD